MKPKYSRSEVVSELKAQVMENAERTILQNRPYTGIQLVYEWRGAKYWATRFSKVNWPDVWSEMKGQNIAMERAAFTIANIIYKEHRGYADLLTLYAELFGASNYINVTDDSLLEMVPQC